MLGWMRRHGDLEPCLVLPDGSKSLIPASWTDLGGAVERRPGAGTLGSASELLHAATLVGGLVHRLESAGMIGRPSRRRCP